MIWLLLELVLLCNTKGFRTKAKGPPRLVPLACFLSWVRAVLLAAGRVVGLQGADLRYGGAASRGFAPQRVLWRHYDSRLQQSHATLYTFGRGSKGSEGTWGKIGLQCWETLRGQP